MKERMQILFDLTKDYLLEVDASDYDIGEAYKFSYVVLRGPRNFLNAFREGELSLDPEAIRNTLARFRRDLPDQYPDFYHEEEKFIDKHNYEVQKLKGKNSSFLPITSQYH